MTETNPRSATQAKLRKIASLAQRTFRSPDVTELLADLKELVDRTNFHHPRPPGGFLERLGFICRRSADFTERKDLMLNDYLRTLNTGLPPTYPNLLTYKTTTRKLFQGQTLTYSRKISA